MSKLKRWSREDYSAALLGKSGLPALRSVARGLMPSDGYALRDFDSWTPRQRKTIRDLYAKLDAIQAQPRESVSLRNKAHLSQAQSQFHGEFADPRFKVAFVPADPSKRDGLKARPRSLKFDPDGVTVTYGNTDLSTVFFDPVRLAEDPAAEVRRVIGQFPTGTVFFLKTGIYTSKVSYSPEALINAVKGMMARYDGAKPFPKNSSKYGDSADSHYWGRWLEGVTGIRAATNAETSEYVNDFMTGRAIGKLRRKLRKLQDTGTRPTTQNKVKNEIAQLEKKLKFR